MNPKHFWFLFGAAAALVGCGPVSAPETDARRLLLKGLGEEIWIPNYVEFEERLDDLRASIKTLCKTPNADSLAEAQEDWSLARAPWKRNELLSFGPAVDLPLRAQPNIDFWPARPDTITSNLEGEEPMDSAALENFGASERGLPVIEYLLFAAEGEPEEAFVGRRCDYLKALATDTKTQATLLREAWDPEHGDYLSNLVGAGRSGKTFPSIEAALGEVVSRLAFIVENVRGEKLANVLGTRSGGTPQPDSAESRFSGRSIDDMRDNLAGVEQVLFGKKKDGASLLRYLDNIGKKTLRAKLREALDASYAALDDISPPLTSAVLEDGADVQKAIDVLAELQTLIQSDLINALGVTLTFNDADGD
jgi:predicted lipoprotein